MSITAMRQALEAMLPVSAYGRIGSKDVEQAALQSAITALRTAIAEAEKQEPIGYASPDNFMALTKTKLYSDYVPVYREAGAQPVQPEPAAWDVEESVLAIHRILKSAASFSTKEGALRSELKSVFQAGRAQPSAPMRAQERKPLSDGSKGFKLYLVDCDENAIEPGVAGAFHAGWEAAHNIKEPAEPVALNESECNRLARERDAAVRLAAERLEQMNADRKQYLDVRDDAHRYRQLRHKAVQLSLSNDTIASLLKDRAELDEAIKQGQTP